MALACPLALAWPVWLYVAICWRRGCPCRYHYGKDPCGIPSQPAGGKSRNCKTFCNSCEEEMEDQRWDLSTKRSRTFWGRHARNGWCNLCRIASGSLRDSYGRDYITEENIWEWRWVGLVRDVSPFHLRWSQFFGVVLAGFGCVFCLVCVWVFCLFVCFVCFLLPPRVRSFDIFWVVCE